MSRIIIAALFWLVCTGKMGWAADVKAAPLLKDQRNATEVIIYNRAVAKFRVPFLGISVEERARDAEWSLRRQLDRQTSTPSKVSLQALPNRYSSMPDGYSVMPNGYSVMLDDVFVFVLLEGDVDPLHQETLEQLGAKTVKALELVVRETHEARNYKVLLQALGLSAAATLVLSLLVWLLHRAKRWLVTWLLNLAHTQAERLALGGESVLQREHIFALIQRGVRLLYTLLILLFCYSWLGFELTRFPYTRPWGEHLNQYLTDLAMQLGSSILRIFPELLVALLIFLSARFIIQLLNTFFTRIEQQKLEFAWLDGDTVRPTRRLVSVGIWLFALVMAYPYLPGSGTEAFKGLSVLLGLMISLGASSLVGQAASGMILMYTRTIRPGEYVQIAGNEGTVVELGLFTTRIRTGLGEELTLPNSLILSNVSRNYSRTVQGAGFILETSVTIGYNTPWRQVHAMLIIAADRTPGVLKEPAPQVFQTALSDFYPAYRLVCQAIPSDPKPRAEVMSALYANIQDVFNEYGVQIMSPHYLGDPAEPKVVPREHWSPLPAGEKDV